MCYLLQSSVFINFELAGVVPDTMMALVIAAGYSRGRYQGMFTGFFCGLLIDFCIGDVVGLCAMFYMFIGYLCGFAHKYYVVDDYTLPVIFIGAGELLYQNMYYTANFLLRGRLNYGYYFSNIMLPKTIYTVAAGIVLYLIFNKINKILLYFEH